MSNLNEFLGTPEKPVEPTGDPVDISAMCKCGNSSLDLVSNDKFKTAHAVCSECGNEVKVTIPEWLREHL